MVSSVEKDLFPIRVLSEKTTVGTSTLRAWERRYGLLTPERTPKGHRLYCERDVKRVHKILELLDDGHSLPAIADMLAANENVESYKITMPVKMNFDETISVWNELVEKT
ncbi:MAG: MerR family transcriptional regulator, partial [Gammaproteobacteria bacterium]|nr:MerR family transcriptional regulator [Gammaproteobacteria bacterium]